jgi:LmbE family N-acetylglucosaminyl deacetylase
MLSLSLPPDRAPIRILCLGAHSDDIEIGCGATLLTLLSTREAEVLWVVFSAAELRAREARHSARLFLKDARRATVALRTFRDGFFPYIGGEIKEYFEELSRQFSPDLIFTHYRHDRHQDHRVISDLAWNTFRDHLIVEYEIPKYDGDLGVPNLFVPVDRACAHRKVRHLRSAFASQQNRHWFTDDTFLGLMRLRGLESRAPHGFAEAFYVRKAVIQTGSSPSRSGRSRRRTRAS